jgi:hypothetical protein
MTPKQLAERKDNVDLRMRLAKKIARDSFGDTMVKLGGRGAKEKNELLPQLALMKRHSHEVQQRGHRKRSQTGRRGARMERPPRGWSATPGSSFHFIWMWTAPNDRSFLMSMARASIGATISILS